MLRSTTILRGVVLCLALLAATLGAAEPAARARAQAFLDELWHSHGAPGISAAVYARGRLVFSTGVGFADLDNMVPATGSTVYNVGSVSKTMAAVAVMQLVEKGEAGLDDPIREYVPGFPEKTWPVTLRHVLTHTSGIRHYRQSDFPDDSPFNNNWKPYASIEEAIGVFKDDPLLFEPGTFFSYTSYGANLLQGVVETASGMGFEEYMRRHVWGPAGMLGSSFDRPERIVPHRARSYLVEDGETFNHPWEDVTYKFAGGGMLSTAEDLVRFGAALLDDRLVQPATRELMFAPQLGDVQIFRGAEDPEPMRWRQGLVWRTRRDDAGRDFVHHCGSVKGFGACLVIYLDEGLVAATADNTNVLGFATALDLADFFRQEGAAISDPEH